MGRGRGKGKKLNVTNNEDPVSGEDEKVPTQKRRGRPQKPLKDDFDEEEVEKIEDDSDNVKRSPSATESEKKRKRNSQVKEKSDSVEQENGVRNGSSTSDELTKPNGFRQNGSRRKSKPRRAAEAGVQCNMVDPAPVDHAVGDVQEGRVRPTMPERRCHHDGQPHHLAICRGRGGQGRGQRGHRRGAKQQALGELVADLVPGAEAEPKAAFGGRSHQPVVAHAIWRACCLDYLGVT